MKIALLLFVAVLVAVPCYGQATSAQATILDPTGKPYVNAPVTANFINPSNLVANWNNSPMTATTWSTNADSSGFFTLVLPDLNFIGPATGAYYQFRICQNNPSNGLPSPSGQPVNPCFTYTSPACPIVGCITGSSIDLSAAIQAVSLPLPTGGGVGSITGVLTPSGSGLQGGGSSGTLSLSLGPCTVPNQVEQWSGSAWVCSIPGGGTIPTAAAASPLVSQGVSVSPIYAAGITYATTAQNWSQVLTTPLTAGSPGSVTLVPCPVGADYTSGAGYQVYISDGASSEAVSVTGGATVGANCSINFTPFFSHGAYTIGSASSGIQETINVACGVFPTVNFNSQCNVTIPANGSYVQGSGLWLLNNYDVYGTIFFHSNQSTLSGYGVSLNCHGRAHCLQVGNQVKATQYQNLTVQGFAFQSRDDHSAATGDNNPAYQGCAITQTQIVATSIATITTATNCGYRPGDLVTIQFTDDGVYWGDAIVATASGTSFTFTKHFFPATRAAQTTPGVVNLAYDAILDNAQNTHFADILYDNTNENGRFSNFFDFWDDENALVEHYNNNAQQLLNNANWTGAHIYSGGNPIGPPTNVGQQWASVITLRDSSITANFSSCATVDNSNGLYIENTICQASAPWQVKASTTRGNFQGAYLKNIYSESNPGANPLSPAHSPFPGTGIAGLIAGVTSGAGNFEIAGGSSTLSGGFASGGSGGTPYSYYIVANDTTANTQTSPMRVLDWNSTGVDTVTVRWPRIANGTDVITYDVIRMTTAGGIGSIFPYIGGCPGGATGTCGYVTGGFGVTQSAACGNNLTCSLSDLTSNDCGSIGGPSTCAYTIKQGNYLGQLNFWPGGLVAQQKTVATTVEQTSVVAVGLNGNPAQTVTTCSNYGNTSASGAYTTCIGSLTTANNSVKSQTATIMTDGGFGGGGQTVTKGRLNFNTTSAWTLQPHHIITLVDSQPDLTRSTITYRPPASVNDTWIGTDVAAAGVALSAGKLAFGAPVAISQYIAALGDGVTNNWGERLTANLKEFQPLVQMDLGFNIPGCTSGQVLSNNGTKFACGIPGVPIDARTTTTEVISNADRLQLVTFNNGGATAITGPALAGNFPFAGLNIGSGLGTFTPASGLVNGNATQIFPSNWFFLHYVDNGNTYTKMAVMPTIQAFPDCQNSGQNRINFTASTGSFTCGTSHTTPIVLFLNADSSIASTSLVAFLSFTFQANLVVNASIDCDLLYAQATGAVSDAFGIQDVSLAPTNIAAQGSVQTAAGVYADGNVPTLTTTIATNIVTFTPSAITTVWNAHLHAMVEQPSGVSSNLNIMSSTSNASDALTIKRGSKCVVNFQ
jgi:hypothetical protein